MNIAELRNTLDVLEKEFAHIDELELTFSSGYSLTNIELTYTASEDGITHSRLVLKGDKTNG
jgi:hypothetical protein